ncbi:MAG: histidine phosphatase family protein [Massiliimalia sp.]|jgi:alpha-ribazole phosphatase
MIRCCFIRHGMTFGNTQKRYIGTTDEPLCEDGVKDIQEKIEQGYYPRADFLFVSPLLRCRQTAELIYPEQEQQIAPGFAETDFGLFENKNYEELKEEPAYQAFLDSMGKTPFPGGESSEQVAQRVCRQMEEIVSSLPEEGTAVFVVHGGTIMHLLARYGKPEKDFYHWQTGNGEGYLGVFSPKEWGKNPEITEICPLKKKQ